MKKIILLVIIVLVGFTFLPKKNYSQETTRFWDVQSIDTMKYSRDPSREKLNDANFDLVIASQVKQIAETGATHVAIATPYDAEFLPMLKRWVGAARRNNLHVWFRGNWSGWEGWFGYPKINRQTHTAKTREFIRNNPDLFVDGDIFSSCPECENGGPGDPRQNGDVSGHRNFLMSDYKETKNAFRAIGKNVRSNFYSMNADVARVIMDKKTTKELDGIVVIDHYVKSSQKLVDDIEEIAQNSGGKVMLGEFGAPIPDIHGNMTEDEQAAWVNDALYKMTKSQNIVGMSYWVNIGGSTRLFNDDGSIRKVVSVLTSYYNLQHVNLKVVNIFDNPLSHASAATLMRTYEMPKGVVSLPFLSQGQEVLIKANGYNSQVIMLEKDQKDISVVLSPVHEDFGYKIRYFIRIVLKI